MGTRIAWMLPGALALGIGPADAAGRAFFCQPVDFMGAQTVRDEAGGLEVSRWPDGWGVDPSDGVYIWWTGPDPKLLRIATQTDLEEIRRRLHLERSFDARVVHTESGAITAIRSSCPWVSVSCETTLYTIHPDSMALVISEHEYDLHRPKPVPVPPNQVWYYSLTGTQTYYGCKPGEN